MTDPAVVIATLGVCVALLSVAMSWLALSHSATVRRSHQRLHKEFWRQSIVQADQNSKVWWTQGASGKPPDVPLN